MALLRRWPATVTAYLAVLLVGCEQWDSFSSNSVQILLTIALVVLARRASWWRIVAGGTRPGRYRGVQRRDRRGAAHRRDNGGVTTVKSHVSAVLDKLGLRNRSQVAVAAHRLGLVPPAPPPQQGGG